MKDNKLLTSVSRSIHMAGFKLKKHSPAILLGAGVVGVVTGAVMACKATLKLNDVLAEGQERIDDIHDMVNDPEANYPEKQVRKDLAVAYVKTGTDLAKLYGPSVIVGGLSIASILASYKVLNGRNVAISAAYAAVDKGFKDYRQRVKERFGEETERELRYNIKPQTVEVIETDENGEAKTVTKTVPVVKTPIYSEFAVIFDETNDNWTRDWEYNKKFLCDVQTWANIKLQTKGHLFLNDVYEALGFKTTKAGQQVGWIYNTEKPIGDNCVDFGIFDIYKEKSREFVNGYEKSIILDFNVDGNILDIFA